MLRLIGLSTCTEPDGCRPPTSASWINQVDSFFALLTERALRRGVFRATAELEKAIKDCIAATNADAKPFRWTHMRARRGGPSACTAGRYCGTSLE
jgi:hypothetical protein